MGLKLAFTGLTFIQAFAIWNPFKIPEIMLVGAILMALGCVLMWLDK